MFSETLVIGDDYELPMPPADGLHRPNYQMDQLTAELTAHNSRAEFRRIILNIAGVTADAIEQYTHPIPRMEYYRVVPDENGIRYEQLMAG